MMWWARSAPPWNCRSSCAAGQQKLPITIAANGGKYRVTAPPMEIDQANPASLWLVIYARRSETEVTRGENAGSTLVEYNIVRDLRTARRLDRQRHRS